MTQQDNIKRMDITEFREFGFLQEVNRQFFHPLGLALEISKEDDGSYKLGGIWDYRDDPEGMYFGRGMINTEKIDRVQSLFKEKAMQRREILGYIIQPPMEVIDVEPSQN